MEVKNTEQKKNQKRSITFERQTLDNLDKAAARRGIPTAQLVREYVDKGLSIEGYSADISFIRTQVREELTAILMPQVNRLIKIVVKTGLMSVASFYVLCEVVADFIPSSQRRALEETIEKSKKKAAIYLKIRDNLMDEVIHSFDENEQEEKSW